MKTQKLRKEQQYNKTVMYEFEYSRDICVEERQRNHYEETRDVTILHFNLNKGEKAYFSEEYRPEGIPKEGTKKPDITAIIEKSSENRVKWYILISRKDYTHAMFE